MRIVLSSIISFFLIQGQDITPPNIAELFIGRAVEKAKENDHIKLEHFRFKKRMKKEALEDDGTVKKLKETKVYLIFKQGEGAVEQLIEKNGKKQKKKPKAGSSNNVKLDFNEILLEKYDFRISGKVPILVKDSAGRWRIAYGLDFFPKQDLEINRREDHLLNKLEGTVYIDSDYRTWRIETKLPDDKNISFSVFGAMYKFDFVLIQKEIDGIMVVDKIIVITKYRFFWSTKYEKRTQTYMDYEELDSDPLE